MKIESYEEEIQFLKQQDSVSSQQSHELITESTILIAVEYQLNQTRETNFCFGQSTEFGILTSTTCCHADELTLIDFESKNKIDNVNNSIWLDEEQNLCFINTMSSFNFVFQSLDRTEGCKTQIYNHTSSNFENNFIDDYLNCENQNCYLNTRLDEEITVLKGSSVICDGIIFGVVLSSKIFKTA